MKLIFCAHCFDVYKLQQQPRSCKCLATSGYYTEDNLHAVIRGESAVPLGFANGTLMYALQHRPQTGDGSVFTAFVIPETCDTIKHEQ